MSRLVHRQTGLRFTSLRRWARLSRGAYLLRETLLTVKAIAIECGFRGASQFCDECQATFGMSPGAFRAAVHTG